MDVVPGRSVSRLEDIVEPQEEKATFSTAATNTDADLALQHEEVPEPEFLSDIEEEHDEHATNLFDIFNNKHYLEFTHCLIVLWAKPWQINAFSLYRCWR